MHGAHELAEPDTVTDSVKTILAHRIGLLGRLGKHECNKPPDFSSRKRGTNVRSDVPKMRRPAEARRSRQVALTTNAPNTLP